MDSEHQKAFDLCLEGHNVLVTGQAGTGKTFLLTIIARALKARGKHVQVTSTTGIASTAFSADLKATTIHRWSGLHDGGYEAKHTAEIIMTSPKQENTLVEICKNDVLIIDEVSMLSRKMFDQLEQICSIVRGSTKYFGGMQIILSGDFYQLPPVPNKQYNDDGEFCFESQVYKHAIPHKVILNKIMRQRNEDFAKVINEVSTGNVSEFTLDFLETVSKSTGYDSPSSVKLFANNFLVDTYNRRKLLEASGDITEFKSVDKGEKRHLMNICAQPTLWLKDGSPVILLRNLSRSLVNGLTGTVVGFDSDGPIVKFPSVNITTTIKKLEFSVYSPKLKRNLATREQIPLKLAYALTIHKAQGMTLDSVEIDCSQIFKAGQLGVAIGRVRTVDGLGIKHFHPRYCLPQPISIDMYLQQPSKDPEPDTHCCKLDRYKLHEEVEIQFTIDSEFEPYSFEDPEEFDEEFDDVIKTLDTDVQVNTSIPEGFSVSSTLNSIKPNAPLLTPKQKEVNDIIQGLSPSGMNEITKFCEKEFFALNAIMDDMNITEPETLTKFIEKCHQHQISAQYKLNCMLCFPNTNILSGHWYITYKLTVAIRQFILSRKEKLFPSAEKEISKRQVTNASKARIRYVGGYCIHKIKEEQVSIVKTHMYSKSVEAQEKYEKASDVLTIVQGMREEEEHLKKTTSDPDSLMDTIRKQYTNKGLTHITDELYQFFVKLCEICLTLLIDKNLNEKGELLFDHCFTEIKRSTELTELFTHACSVSTAMESTGQSLILPPEDSHQIEAVMNGILKKVSIMEYLFTLVIKKFLFIMLVQFRADLIQAFEVAKTMSHRQQIQLRKKKEESLKSITFKTITDDNTDRKHMSHSLLQGMLLRKTAILEPMTKPQLLVLCKAYNLPAKTQSKKAEIVTVLTEGILNSQCMSKTEVFVPHASTSAQEPVPSTSTMSSCSTHDSGEPTTHTSRGNVSEAIPITSVLELPILDMETVESDEELCKVCHTKGKSNVEWIQCDSCNQWLHRNCAGLRSKAKWNKFQDEGIPFMCTECI